MDTDPQHLHHVQPSDRRVPDRDVAQQRLRLAGVEALDRFVLVGERPLELGQRRGTRRGALRLETPAEPGRAAEADVAVVAPRGEGAEGCAQSTELAQERLQILACPTVDEVATDEQEIRPFGERSRDQALTEPEQINGP